MVGKIAHSDDYLQDWDEIVPSSRDRTGKVDDLLYGILKDTNIELQDDDLQDWHSADHCADVLKRSHDKPFFLACGLVKPHLPLVVPRKYHDLFPEDQIVLPPVKWDDLDDVPDIAVELTERELIHERVLRSGRWKLAVGNYLACMAYFDAVLGKVLRALETGPNSHNTLLVFWSDHGLHLGEKQRWKKHTLWEESTHVPMIWSVPWMKGKGLCNRVVETLSIFPTLCELSGLPIPASLDGKSIAGLVQNPKAKWDCPAFSTWGRGSHSVRYRDWRYIRYRDGSEELYDHRRDPYEWTNLSGNAKYRKDRDSLFKELSNAILNKEQEQTRKLLALGKLNESSIGQEDSDGD